MQLLPVLPEIGNWRFEYKYHLSLMQYHQVRAAIRPYMRLDNYTRRTQDSRYLVRSLYFDTFDFRAYQEKVNGDRDRTKLRVRTYFRVPRDNPGIRVEMKSRKGIVVEKHSVFVPPASYDHFLAYGSWLQSHDPILIEFERFVRLKDLHPQVLVEYHREGYRALEQDDLRITFDHQVGSAPAKTLFPDHFVFRRHHRGTVILEIKCNKSQPYWLRQIAFAHGLRVAANSKFAQAVQLSRPEMVNPAWSY